MTHGRSTLVLFIVALFFLSSVQAQRPAERYQATIEAGHIEPRVRAFVTSCLHSQSQVQPLQLYAQGDWFVTPGLAAHMKEQGSNDDGSAEVWIVNGHPRAVSLWVHDDEFDRSTLACLDESGAVLNQTNEYMPGMSEPDLHWIYVHTFTRAGHASGYHASGHYTDWNRRPIAAPKLTSEDRDFIAGERRYDHWTDFDFASAYERSRQATP